MHCKSKTRLCFTSFDIIVNVYLNIDIIRAFKLYQISDWQLFLPKCIVDSDEVNKSALHNLLHLIRYFRVLIKIALRNISHYVKSHQNTYQSGFICLLFGRRGGGQIIELYVN